MGDGALVPGVGILAAGLLVVSAFWVWRRRRPLKPLPAGWTSVLKRNDPFYARLAPSERALLAQRMREFLHTKHFEGCGGLALTDEIRVTIAAQACRLALHRPGPPFPGLISVLVYPTHYAAPHQETDGAVVSEAVDARLGEAWREDVIVLSWDDVRRGAHAGSNVVLHEFAHQLDAAEGESDGVPRLDGGRPQYAAWARVMASAYQTLQKAAGAGTPIVLDPYGTENPAEFFAVATEAFFERPHALRRRFPELYQKLSEFYRQDPANQAQPAPPRK